MVGVQPTIGSAGTLKIGIDNYHLLYPEDCDLCKGMFKSSYIGEVNFFFLLLRYSETEYS